MRQSEVFLALRITLLTSFTALTGLMATAFLLRRQVELQGFVQATVIFYALTCLAIAWIRREPEVRVAALAHAEPPDQQGVHIRGRKAGSAQHYALPVALRDVACPVCTGALAAPVRVCCACETAVHDMCWAYSGGCARYACVEASTERSGDGANRTAKSIST